MDRDYRRESAMETNQSDGLGLHHLKVRRRRLGVVSILWVLLLTVVALAIGNALIIERVHPAASYVGRD